MIDLAILRKDFQFVITQLSKRKSPQNFLDEQIFLSLESERKVLQKEVEDELSKRNQLSKQIGFHKSKGDSCDMLMGEVTKIKNSIENKSRRLDVIQIELAKLLYTIPNLPDPSVPDGLSESDNVEIRRVGIPKIAEQFGFPVRDHVDLGVPLGMDFEAGVKLSGSRFVVLKSCIARLHRALTQFMLEIQTTQHGYTECYTPYLVLGETLKGTGQLPKFEADLFGVFRGLESKFEDVNENLYLIPTAEVTLTNLYRDEVLKEDQLPIKLTAHTPCFRSEAGSGGRDVRGMIRQHQFDKVEMVQIVHPSASSESLEEMTSHAENILKLLGLPYRVVLLCSGDMGFAANKTYDIEVWLPSQNTYREISSVSNCGDFQARRLQMRYKTASGKNELVHTLNGSGLAVGRTLVAILENFQNEDGSITIPDILVPYMGGETKLHAQ